MYDQFNPKTACKCANKLWHTLNRLSYWLIDRTTDRPTDQPTNQLISALPHSSVHPDSNFSAFVRVYLCVPIKGTLKSYNHRLITIINFTSEKDNGIAIKGSHSLSVCVYVFVCLNDTVILMQHRASFNICVSSVSVVTLCDLPINSPAKPNLLCQRLNKQNSNEINFTNRHWFLCGLKIKIMRSQFVRYVGVDN